LRLYNTNLAASTSGGVDSKITSFSRFISNNNYNNNNFKKHEKTKVVEALVSAQSGPTHDDQDFFQWSGSAWQNQIHAGQPDVFNFDFVEIDFFKY
jgi:hypothetical protein